MSTRKKKRSKKLLKMTSPAPNEWCGALVSGGHVTELHAFGSGGLGVVLHVTPEAIIGMFDIDFTCTSFVIEVTPPFPAV